MLDVIEEPLMTSRDNKKINNSETGLTSRDDQSYTGHSQIDSAGAHELEEIENNLAAPKGIRQTNLRWLMLTFGCAFLMGSYYCYDIPAVAQP